MKPNHANTLTLVSLVLLAGNPGAGSQGGRVYPNAIDATLQAATPSVRPGCVSPEGARREKP